MERQWCWFWRARARRRGPGRGPGRALSAIGEEKLRFGSVSSNPGRGGKKIFVFGFGGETIFFSGRGE